MNKILRLALSADENDNKIAKELYPNFPELREHFMNIVKYVGPRSYHSESERIEALVNHLNVGEKDKGWYIYESLARLISIKDMKEIRVIWGEEAEGLNVPSQKEGLYFPEALQSVELLMKQNE